jgi:hypothetical protein
MTQWLKQSTAVTVKIGPFVDSTDGVTAETGLTISQANIRLTKNGGAFAQTNNATGATHDENGYYGVPLDTTDTNTLGTLRVAVNESGALLVWQDFMVVPANVWDSLFGADKLQVHADEITAGLITAAAIATNAIDADAVAADAGTEIQSGLATAAALATVDTVVDAILVDTDTTIPGLIAALNDLSAAAVNAEVVDALATDTYAEPTGVPGATVALATKIGYLYMALRNQVTVTATKKTFFDDGGAAEWEKDLSDDSTTYTETEANSI